jgi:hypothetical protein
MEFRGLQIYNNKSIAEEALRRRKKLTQILEKKRYYSMKGNQRAIGNQQEQKRKQKGQDRKRKGEAEKKERNRKGNGNIKKN